MSLKLPPIPSFSDVYEGRKMRNFATILENTFAKLSNLVSRSDSPQTYSNTMNESTIGSTPTTLRDTTIPAGSLKADGYSIQTHLWGTFGATNNTKDIVVNINNMDVLHINTAQSGGTWIVDIELVRQTDSTANCLITTNTGVSTSAPVNININEAITINVVGTGTADSDITCNVLIATVVPAKSL